MRALYGTDVQLFPPPGLDARHSYFAEPDTSRPGRLYLGVMAQGHTAGRAAVTTAAAMLQGAWEEAARSAAHEGKDLFYRSQGKGHHHLLKSFDQYGGLWETLHSMRNVDRECQVTVKGAGQ